MSISITTVLKEAKTIAKESGLRIGEIPGKITTHSKESINDLVTPFIKKIENMKRPMGQTNDYSPEIRELTYMLKYKDHNIIPTFFFKALELSNKIATVPFGMDDSDKKSCASWSDDVNRLIKNAPNSELFSQKTINNYSRDSSDKTATNVYFVTFVLLDLLVTDSSYRERACPLIHDMLTQNYTVYVSCSQKPDTSIDRFGQDVALDKSIILNLILGLKNNTKFIMPVEQNVNQNDGFTGIKLGLRIREILPIPSSEIIPWLASDSLNSIWIYLQTLFPDLDYKPEKLELEYTLSWIMYKYTNDSIQPTSIEYRAFLLYHLIHKLEWTGDLDKNQIRFNISYDYYDALHQKYKNVGDCISNGKLPAPTDLQSAISFLLPLEEMIITSDVFKEFIRKLPRVEGTATKTPAGERMDAEQTGQLDRVDQEYHQFISNRTV